MVANHCYFFWILGSLGNTHGWLVAVAVCVRRSHSDILAWMPCCRVYCRAIVCSGYLERHLRHGILATRPPVGILVLIVVCGSGRFSVVEIPVVDSISSVPRDRLPEVDSGTK